MTDDERLERELRVVIRASAPDTAPAHLRDRVLAALQAPAPRSWLQRPAFLAAAGGAVTVVLAATIILGPRYAWNQTGPSQPLPTLGTAGVSSKGPATQPPPSVSVLPETITSPGEVQVGDLLTATDGWVQNIDGHLYLTHSGGDAWRETERPGLDPDRVFLTSFIDLQHGWVAQLDREGGDDLRLWRTTDAGQTWQETLIPGAKLIVGGLAFLDASAGYLTTDPGGQHPKPELRWTHDGGATWSDPIDLAAASGIPTLQIVDFFDGRAGLMTGLETFLRTNDGGRTWFPPQSLDPDVRFLAGTPRYGALHVVDATTGFVLVQWVDGDGKELRRAILETRDAGTSWETSYTDELHRSWAFIDALRWIGTNGSQVWSTNDGGLTFEAAPSTGLPVVLDFAAMGFVDPMHGWAQAMGGVPCKGFGCLRFSELFKTADGGRTWSLVGDCGSFIACASPRPS